MKKIVKFAPAKGEKSPLKRSWTDVKSLYKKQLKPAETIAVNLWIFICNGDTCVLI